MGGSMNWLFFTLGLMTGLGLTWLVFRRPWPLSRHESTRQLLNALMADRAQIQEVEEERDRLFNLSIDLLAISDLEGRLLQVNPAWVRVLRWSRDEVMALAYSSLFHPDDRPAAMRALAELRNGTPVRDVELRTRCRDGSYRWISWSSFPLTVRKTIFTVARDITERKQAREQLQRYQQRLKALASQLATVEERQNRRLAEILHDTLAQDLFAAQTKLSLLEHSHRVEDPQAVVQEVLEILKQANELTRTLTFELTPPALYEIGLDAALEWLCRSFKRTRGLDCRFANECEIPQLDHDLRALLYQGTRELLTNVYKHADASFAEITLACEAHLIVLQVDDDGRGFDHDLQLEEMACGSSSGGFGLFNLRERLGQLGGKLHIDRSASGGVRVTITVPLARESI
jgi:PAS domain S-box-containing protein